MSLARRRRRLLAGLVAGLLLLCGVVLFDVLQTVFFAVTVAYVLYPVQRRLVDRGVPAYWASAVVTGAAFGVVLVVVAAFALVLYNRRESLFTLLRTVPKEVTVPLGEFSYTLDTTTALATARGALQSLAVDVATAAPVLALKLFLFAILLFALLVRPGSVGRTAFAVTPPAYHDVLVALDRRVRETLYGIYVLQAATAAGTFAVALVVFGALGYGAPFTLAVVAGILQFIPIVGPGVLVAALAGVDILTGMPTRAILVAVLGAVFVGLAPDAIIRPRLASRAAHLPTSLYFIGFTGGLLTVGAIGFIAGPLVVALLVETVELLSRTAKGRQARLDVDGGGPSGGGDDPRRPDEGLRGLGDDTGGPDDTGSPDN
ncbi:AI-2E family transporter [Haloglomus litoreum]|uniref:AI-2E family transporter n=1 Tax=Haloglomus litoreum TaxID=3034026 RepID=UPI0023E77CA4|nr:AI-2E family transporter [Haloglomus sp. DT116]